jgi:hypothetical protein
MSGKIYGFFEIAAFCKSKAILHEKLEFSKRMGYQFYLLKDDTGDNSKLTMRPVWDFEWTIGIGWYDGARPRPANYWVLNDSGFYYDRMLQDASGCFRMPILRRW